MDLAVRRRVGGQHTQFHRIQRGTGIPARQIRQKIQSILIDFCMIGPHAPLGVVHRPMDDGAHIFYRKGPQLKNGRSG